MRYLFIMSFFSMSAFAQLSNLSAQLGVVKELMPSVKTVGIIYGPNSEDSGDINTAASQNGLHVVVATARTLKEMALAMRAIAKHNVDFVYLLQDSAITSKNAIRFAVKATIKDKIPVLTTAEEAFDGGAFGQVYLDGESWHIYINGKVVKNFDIPIPDNFKFKIKE